MGHEGVKVRPVVGVAVGEDQRGDQGRIEMELEGGERPRAQVDHQVGTARRHQVAAPGSAGAGPTPVAAEHPEDQPRGQAGPAESGGVD
jgi:hypothetical protein